MGAVAKIGAGGSLNHHRRWCWVFFERMGAIEKVVGCFLNGRRVSEGVWFVFEWVAVLVVEQGGGYRIAMGGSIGHHLGVGTCSKDSEGGGGDQWQWQWVAIGGISTWQLRW